MSKKKQEAPVPTLDIPVQFGGVSIGQATAKLSMKIERKFVKIQTADDAFCGRRIKGRIQLGGGNDQPGQQKFIETDLQIEGSFDIHRFGVTADHFTTGATFKLKEIDISDFAQFSKGSGRLIAEGIENIPDDSVDDEHEDDSESLPGTYAVDGPWAKASLDGLFSGAILKNLKSAGLETVGDLYEYQKPSKGGYVKLLTDIKGIGEGAAQKIEDTMVHFWKDNPQE